MAAVVPIVVLTGFLGSGKTTLLNQLLATGSPMPGKLAVIVNEFGAVGIDGDLLPDEMTRQVELPGGCICCLLDEDLEKTIALLLEGDRSITLIIIETTGIAEPLPISWTLAREPLSELVRLAAVVTTIDALEHVRHRPMSPSVDAQVIDADILAITKTDLASSEDVEALAALLRTQNSYAPIFTADLNGRLRKILADPALAHERNTPAAQAAGSHGHEAGHDHRHMESVDVEISGVLDLEELSDQLQELGENYLRIKGFATVIDEGAGWDEPVWAAIHRVGARVSAERLDGPRRGEPRLVAVGYSLDAVALSDCVDRSRVDQ